MAVRRMISNLSDMSATGRSPVCLSTRSSLRNSGSTRLLEIMIANATQATMTIAVAADRPPTKTRKETVQASFSSGSAKT